jgi:hypothetical protein
VVRHTYLLPLWSVLTVGAVAAAVRLRERIPPLSRGLNLIAGALVLVNLATVGVNEAAARQDAPVAAVRTTLHPSSRPPDIYYIVFEEYAGERPLRDDPSRR